MACSTYVHFIVSGRRAGAPPGETDSDDTAELIALGDPSYLKSTRHTGNLIHTASGGQPTKGKYHLDHLLGMGRYSGSEIHCDLSRYSKDCCILKTLLHTQQRSTFRECAKHSLNVLLIMC